MHSVHTADSSQRSTCSHPLVRRAVVLVALALLLLWPAVASAASLASDVHASSTFGAGGFLSLAVKDDGSLWAWGYDLRGELPSEHIEGMLTPTRVGADSDWVLASASMAGSLALKSDGSLWSIEALVGDETTVLQAARVGGDNDWVAVSAGLLASLALKSNGTLWSVGYDFSALFSDEPLVDAVPSMTATRLGADNDWSAVSCGFLSSLALKTDGSMWALEYDVKIDLSADLETLQGLSIETMIDRIGTETDWVVASMGGAHALAIKDDGSLWTMGDNEVGQLGDGTTETRAEFARIGSGTDWIDVSAGLTHSMAIKADGSLWTWGNNEDGQLGDGTLTTRNAPVRIGAQTAWLSVSAGYGHSLALDADESLWAWGDNYFGQLGDGTTVGRQTPVKVLAEVMPPPPSQMVPFSDVVDSPYRRAIAALSKRGVISGYDDGTFRPAQPVSRQQFAKMIVLGLGLPVTEGGVPLAFADVGRPLDNLYPDDYVAVASTNKLIQGYPDGLFKPFLDITRAQLLTIVTRSAQSFKPALLRTPPPNWVGGLTTTNPAHGANIRVAEYSGLVAGLDLATFDVDGKATRGEIAQIIWNLTSR